MGGTMPYSRMRIRNGTMIRQGYGTGMLNQGDYYPRDVAYMEERNVIMIAGDMNRMEADYLGIGWFADQLLVELAEAAGVAVLDTQKVVAALFGVDNPGLTGIKAAKKEIEDRAAKVQRTYTHIRKHQDETGMICRGLICEQFVTEEAARQD